MYWKQYQFCIQRRNLKMVYFCVCVCNANCYFHFEASSSHRQESFSHSRTQMCVLFYMKLKNIVSIQNIIAIGWACVLVFFVFSIQLRFYHIYLIVGRAGAPLFHWQCLHSYEWKIKEKNVQKNGDFNEAYIKSNWKIFLTMLYSWR